MITLNELKDKLKEYGYYATNELLYDTFNALLLFNSDEKNIGQDIYAICLEGPPGAGKTEFAKTYRKIANDIFNNVELVDYQCDATTGKTELFEDINISAAIRGDADNVNIPGKLIEAIKKVNEGKKVILFIDEYDKAREETDAFLLQFLQSGKINSTQHGDLEIKDEYKENLQVILCKNDMRENLSGPLSRRIRYLRLDYMKPKTFYEVANRRLIKERKNKVSEELINLVSLMYESAYNNKDIFNRLPSCSEMLIAIEDADRMIKIANASQNIIYKIIIKNMFKSKDDIKTFESSILKDNKLKEIMEEMKSNEKETKEGNIKNLIAEKIFTEEKEILTEKISEMENLIENYKNKFNRIEEIKENNIQEKTNQINLKNGTIKKENNKPKSISNFDDESLNIKRGHDIFEISNNDWVEIGNIYKEGLSNKYFIDILKKYANKLDIIIYENGISLKKDNDQKLIIIRDKSNINEYKILSNYPIIPSCYLKDIDYFINIMLESYKKQNNILDKQINSNGYINIDTLVYNDVPLTIGNEENENVYFISINENKLNPSNKYIISNKDNFICNDPNNSIISSKKLIKNKIKVINNE